jgi:DNA-binding NarL/FixJ family response regulator
MHKRLSERLLLSGSHAPGSLLGLSEREFEVLHLIGLGFGTRQIAEPLNRSVKTVEAHQARLKEKLHLESGRDLIQFAIKFTEEL